MKHKSLTVFAPLTLLALALACGEAGKNEDGDEGQGGNGGASSGEDASSGGRTSGGGAGGGDAEPDCDEDAPAPVLYLKGNGNFTESMLGHTATSQGDVSTDAGKYGDGFVIAPVTEGSYITAPVDDSYEVGIGNFTIAFWMKMSDGFVILDKRVQSGAYQGYQVYVYEGHVGFQLGNGSKDNNFNSSSFASPTLAKVDDGEWHHVAITVERISTTGIKFYQDGVLLGSANPTGFLESLTNETPLLIGASASSLPSTTFVGVLDELQIFKEALTEEQVTTLASAPTLDFCD